MTYQGSRGLFGCCTGICKRTVATVRPLTHVYRHGCLRSYTCFIPTYQFLKLTAHINCEENGGLLWAVDLVLAKTCSPQTTDTSIQVYIFWEIIPYFAFVDFSFFKIKIKSKSFRDRIAPHHWQ